MTSDHDDGRGVSRRKILECMTWAGTGVLSTLAADKFSFTFTTAGAYEYFCSLHPHMTGTIVVEGATGGRAAQ